MPFKMLTVFSYLIIIGQGRDSNALCAVVGDLLLKLIYLFLGKALCVNGYEKCNIDKD